MKELNKIIQGDVRKQIKLLPDNSVDCCVTSPPYWGLRDYGTAKWIGGDINCDHLRGNESWMNGQSKAVGSKQIEKISCRKCNPLLHAPDSCHND
jgi:DNA modification methylase